MGEVRQGARTDTREHLLRNLKLPARYEPLSGMLGPEVAQILTAPAVESLDLFRLAALHINSRRMGLFLPIYAGPGTGKTTLVSNISTWLPSEYALTVRLAGGEVSADRLRSAVEAAVSEGNVAANDTRSIVVNVDDRESDQPSEKEISQIKSFLRESGEGAAGLGSRVLLAWLETSKGTAAAAATGYEERAGKSPIQIPAKVDGPPREMWPDIAKQTLKMVNAVDHLEELGVNPDSYDANAYESLGLFLEAISFDFVQNLNEHIKSSRKPVRLVIAFASESAKAGILNEFSSGFRYGLLDPDKLVAATPASDIGKWWGARMGDLITAIVRLDARVVCLSPSLSIPVIQRYGAGKAVDFIDATGFSRRSPKEIREYFERSDFGRVLTGTASAASETRGNPGSQSAEKFRQLAAHVGFSQGRDKKNNTAFADFLVQNRTDLGEVVAEKQLQETPLIPDLSILDRGHDTCVEFYWRSGDFLLPKNRSDAAQYILRKIKNYSVELGWVKR